MYFTGQIFGSNQQSDQQAGWLYKTRRPKTVRFEARHYSSSIWGWFSRKIGRSRNFSLKKRESGRKTHLKMKSGFLFCCCCRKRKERESEVVNWRDAVVGSVRSHISLKRWFWSGGDVWREDTIASSLLSTFSLVCFVILLNGWSKGL